MSKIKCWDFFNCGKIDCVAYENFDNNYPCWTRQDAICRDDIGPFNEKIQACLKCEVFKSSINKGNAQHLALLLGSKLQETNDRLQNSHVKLDDYQKQADEISMELTLGVSEILAVLQQFVKGDYSARAKEESKIEIISQLAKITNSTIFETGKLIQELDSSIQTFHEIFKKVKQGDTKARVDSEFRNPVINELRDSVNDILADLDNKVQESYDSSMSLALGLSETFEVLKKLSDGDFTTAAKEDNPNELLSQLGKVVNQTISNLQNVIHQMQRIASEISSSSTEISSTNEEIVFKASEEIKFTSEASTTITELTTSIQQVARNANDVSHNVNQGLELVHEGDERINAMINKMNSTADVVEKTAQNLVMLQGKAQEIQEILTIINRISDKIDLLALNAAIEASNVGEAGKSFRVVVDEMRKLADDSINSAKQIENVLTGIHKGIENAGILMKKNVEDVNSVMGDLHKTGDSMKKIVSSSEKSSSLVKEVSIAANQQAKATELFSNVIDQINVSANETVKGIENAKLAIDGFVEISQELKGITDKFKVKKSD